MKRAVLLLAAFALSGCLVSGVVPANLPLPEGGSIDSEDAWKEGPMVIAVREQFIRGNTGGPYVGCGNFGVEGRGWARCYGHGVSVRDGIVRVDFSRYVPDLMMPGQTYCWTPRSERRADDNWRSNHGLAPGQRYYSPPDENLEEHPNLSVYVYEHPDGRYEVFLTNEFAPEEYQQDNAC